MASTAKVDLLESRAFPDFMDGRQRCADADPDVFYGLDKAARDAARAVCEHCELRAPCLVWAVRTNQQFGVWAGTTAGQRRKLRRRMGVK